MMMRNTFSVLLLSLLAFAFACSSGQSSSDGATETEQTAEPAPSDNAAAPADAGDAAYVTTVLKGDIASPKKEMKGSIGDTQITVVYGSPSVKGRTVWGGIVPHGQVWRTGANEATTIEVSGDIAVEGQNLPAGKYGLFTIPSKDGWVIIFNETWEQWGAYEYDESKDVLRVNVSPTQAASASETMEFIIDGNALVLLWENLSVPMKMGS